MRVLQWQGRAGQSPTGFGFMEHRLSGMDFRVGAEPLSGGAIIFGLAVPYGKPSLVLHDALAPDERGYVEEFAPGACAKMLRACPIPALILHDPRRQIACSKDGTLRLWETPRGVYVDIRPGSAALGARALASVEAGELRAVSLKFVAWSSKWDRTSDGIPLRRVLGARVLEVSLVPRGAYRETWVAAVPQAPHGSALVTRTSVSILDQRSRAFEVIVSP